MMDPKGEIDGPFGFGTEDDWFEYRLENDPAFLKRVEKARRSLKAGKGVRLEDLPD